MNIAERPPESWRTTLDTSGRVRIPAELRRSIGIQPGGQLTWVKEDRGIVLRTFDDVLREMQAYFTSLPDKGEELASDQLIRERREEAAREDAESDGVKID